MAKQIDPSLISAFQNLADFTAPKCGACRAPFACCSADQCQAVKDFALQVFGVDLQETGSKLPFLGEKGCVVAPHLRPLCAVHVCEVHLNDPQWSEDYFELREKASDLLEDHMSSIDVE